MIQSKYRALLIDPATREVTEIKITDTLKDITEKIGCEFFETIQLPWRNTRLLCDEEARIKRAGDPSFTIHRGSMQSCRIIGRGLIVSCDALGKIMDVIPMGNDLTIQW